MMDGKPFPKPDTWDGDMCPACAASGDPEGQAERLLLKGMKPMNVSRLCAKLGTKRVTEIRKELMASGDLDPDVKIKSAPIPKPEPERKSVVTKSPSAARTATDELLRAEPELPNKVLAERAGASVSLVKSRRRALGLGVREQRPERRTGPKPKWETPADLSGYPAGALG